MLENAELRLRDEVPTESYRIEGVLLRFCDDSLGFLPFSAAGTAEMAEQQRLDGCRLALLRDAPNALPKTTENRGNSDRENWQSSG